MKQKYTRTQRYQHKEQQFQRKVDNEEKHESSFVFSPVFPRVLKQVIGMARH